MKALLSTTSRKVLFVLYGTLLVLSVGLVAWLHNGQTRALQDEALSRLRGVTGTLAAQVEPGRVERLLATYDSRGMLIKNTQDAWYYVLHETLRKSAVASALDRPLRIVAYDARKQELQIVVTSADRPQLREAYEGPAAGALIQALHGASSTSGKAVSPEVLVTFDRLDDTRDGSAAAVVAECSLEELHAVALGRLWRNIGITGLILLVVGSFLFRSVGRMVEDEESARADWQQRHAGITDSIAYAGKIQGALVPRPERFREQFEEFFVLNRPKDVVSGDFHWYHRLSDHECFVATADCTGHGLPGAMMAAIGCSLLNELVVQHPHADPAELLGLLNTHLVRTLNQGGQRKGAGDGMDIALCRVDRVRREILFAGAYRPLYWMHDGQLTVINGDRRPVGGSQHDPHRKFSVHRIAYHRGDRIYLFSDGYVDQFGGPERRKFMTKRFNDLLVANQHVPLPLQADLLERTFLEWQGEHEQVDDVCVLGIAV